MANLGKISSDATSPAHLRFVVEALRHLRSRGINQVVIPCCGLFALIKAAIQAGFPASSVTATGMSLLSSVLGYYYAGRPLSDLPFVVRDAEMRERYERCGSDTDRLSLLLLALKASQFQRPHERRYAEALKREATRQADRMAHVLESLRGIFKGISYEVEDLRAVPAYGEDPARLIVVNPWNAGDKTSRGMDALVESSLTFPRYDPKKESRALYESLRPLKAVSLVYRVGDLEGVDAREAVFASEISRHRTDYWLCTHPEILDGWSFQRSVKYRSVKPARPCEGLSMFSDADRLTLESIISFRCVAQEEALYYRDLWAHRLGDTVAERDCVCLINGKIFAICGFHAQKVRLGVEEYIFETFGFGAPLSRYPNSTRLLMLLITSQEFARWLRGALGRKNRTYVMRGLKTTCLSKYRKLKQNNGILPVVSTNKLTDGAFRHMYRIVYQVNWYERSYKDCIALYLSEIESRNRKDNSGASESSSEGKASGASRNHPRNLARSPRRPQGAGPQRPGDGSEGVSAAHREHQQQQTA